MRICFVLPGYGWKPSGGYRVVYEYASRLADRGHKVTVVHPRGLPGFGPTAHSGSSLRLRRTAGRVRDFLLRPSLWWQEIDPRVQMAYVSRIDEASMPDGDAVFATAVQTVAAVHRLGKSKGVKVYLVMDFPPFQAPEAVLAETWRLPFRKVAISTWLAEMVEKAGGRDVMTISPGLDFRNLGCDRIPAERDSRVAMMISKPPYKAPEDGIRAMVLARDVCNGLEGVAFGDPPRPAGLPEWIRYERRPTVDHLRWIYNSAGVFLSSSLAEGFALPPAEAMACGCAVVTTDSGGNRDYAIHGVTALVSPPGRPDLLAENLARLVKEPALRIRLAQRGAEYVRQLTWDSSADRLEAFISQPS